MSTNSIYFRPKARHIFSIWKDLIKDNFSALIELVKNSYDADASKVIITFEKYWENQIKITISDDWHWMSEEIIKSVWFVPSTNSKRISERSPKWRIFQWQKWIWRYAAAALWNNLTLTTVKDWTKSEVKIEWNKFDDDNKFLDEVPFSIITERTSEKNWTTIEIIWDSADLNFWLGSSSNNSDTLFWFEWSDNIQKLENELKKLIPPMKYDSWFCIELSYDWKKHIIERNSMVDYYDYKISWTIDDSWKIEFFYENADTKEIKHDNTKIDINSRDNENCNNSDYPWLINFEFFVFDRDPISERNNISIKHGRNITNRNEALDFFKKFSGISIYREWFRIRPYWDPWEDWLWLNARRVNNPTLRLSSNQIIWYVTIKSESESHLIEASSRERLKENSYYNWLIYELRKTLSILEEERFRYRQLRKSNIKWGKIMDVNEEINKIKDGVQWIKSEWDKEKTIKDIEELWHKFEKEKERLEKIIYQYEWQVTLWKIMFIMFHELNKPIKFIRDNMKNIKYYSDKIRGFSNSLDMESLTNLLEWYERNSKIISDFLSKKMAPLIKRKSKKSYFDLIKVINQSIDTYSDVCKSDNIVVIINNSLDWSPYVYWYDTDFLISLVNFMDNSIYRLNYKWDNNKKIVIELKKQNWNLVLLFKDNGFWIDYLDNKDDILEPWFSKKEWWTWLGLSIAWEVLERNDSKLEILDSDWEFNFILRIVIKQWEKR